MDSAHSSSFYYKRGMMEEARRARQRERPRTRVSERSLNSRLLDQVLEQYGRKCGVCGFDSDQRILQLDHVNGGGNQERRRIGTRGIRRRALERSNEYQLLCPNCNWTKRFDRAEQNPRKTSQECEQ